jgi:pimeloyl-ACP methyl ester carboxylesterase
MPDSSSIARLQRLTTLTLLCAAVAWAAWFLPLSPLIAFVGVAGILLGHTVFLGAELLLLATVARPEGAPRPPAGELVRAWIGETFISPQVFCWRQPFRWRAVPDHLPAASGRRGVVLVHGFVCNRGFWNPWLSRLRELDVPFAAVNLEPLAGPIEAYAPILDAAVRRVQEATGLPPVLVCHSMGGLAARAWLARTGQGRVHHVVTLGSPHRGTWLAHWSRLPNGRQMIPDNAWLQQLATAPLHGAPPFTCWYSNCDNVVFPVETATLPGADNRMVRAAGHVQLAFRAEVMKATIALITRR